MLRRLEWRTLDWRTNFRVHFQPAPDPRITVVLFDDGTENVISWPPDRSVHGEMIKFLTLTKPAVVTWDVILDATREGTGDAEMARAAAIAVRAGVKVITGAVTDPASGEIDEVSAGLTRALTRVEGDIGRLLGDAGAILPFPLLRAESLYGFVDTPAGEDGMRREIPLVVRVGAAVYPSLALQTIMAFFDVPAERVRVRLGEAVHLSLRDGSERVIPISERGRFLLNYRYDQNEKGADFSTFSYFATMLMVHETLVEKTVMHPLPQLEDGVVFIGQTVTGKADIGPTPRSAAAPLVLVHANVLNNVLTGDFARTAPPWAVWLGAMALGTGGMLIGARSSVWVLVTFGALSVSGYVAVGYLLWITSSVWVPLAAPVLGFVGLQFWVIGRRAREEQQGREQVKRMFGTYLSPELLSKMLKEGRSVMGVTSDRRAVTVLFSDLRNFTRLAEELEDDALVSQLNEYLAAMVECIHAHGGTLHKFIGDAVMAVWGDLSSEGAAIDAAKAARAALQMQRTLDDLNTRWAGSGKPVLRMGVGLNHGVVLIGNIGSPRRMEFAAIGDAVNLASRLESLNKELNTQILLGESLQQLLGEEFELHMCGSFPIKGKAQAVKIFELRGFSKGDERKLHCIGNSLSDI